MRDAPEAAAAAGPASPRRRGLPFLDAELRRGLDYVLPYRRRLGVLVLLSLASTALALYLPYLSKALVDDAFVARDAGALLRIVALFVIASLAGFALNVVTGLRYTRLSADILFDMRLKLYRHLQRLSPRFYARTPLGEIVSRLNNDVGEIQRVAAETALGWIGNVVFLAGAVGVMLWLDARLFVVSLLVLPPSIMVLVLYRRRLEGSIALLRQRSAEIGSFLIETLQGVRAVVASNAQQREVERFGARNGAFVTALMRMQSLRYLAGGLPGLLLTMSTAVVFLYGGVRVIDGAISLGTFVAFLAYQTRLLAPVQGLMGLYTNMATIRVSLRRVHELLDTPPDVVEAASPVSTPVAVGMLVLDDVGYGYGRGEAVLDGVSLRIEPGESIALVGASGAGKSTLADLLVRHCDPERGRVLLDDVDLRSLALAELRRRVAIVDQDPFLFHATLRDNIRYARPDASEAELAAAVAAAALDDLVGVLPAGLDTMVGERGRQLSAGERQRVALARALLADPVVLVLDEPTAALDPAAEARVLRGYENAMRGRTTLVISHRLELARQADRIAVLHGGRVAELGSADALLAAAGPFRALFGAAQASRAQESRAQASRAQESGEQPTAAVAAVSDVPTAAVPAAPVP
jgi:ATP-binding cassette, subfamily B, bacterial